MRFITHNHCARRTSIDSNGAGASKDGVGNAEKLQWQCCWESIQSIVG